MDRKLTTIFFTWPWPIWKKVTGIQRRKN